MEVLDLDSDCFLVKLDNEQDYFRALTDGPWVMFDHYLVVQQWSPDFSTSDPLPKTMIVWVQFPALKVHFYHKEVLTVLGNLIGRTIKLDYHTLTQQRAKFARLAVEVDLSKHLVPRIFLDGRWQKVEYENLPLVCFECGRIGHMKALCPSLRPEGSAGEIVLAGSLSSTMTRPAEVESNLGFGPWMLVTKKNWRNSRDNHKKGKSEMESGNPNQANVSRNNKSVGKNKESGESTVHSHHKAATLQRSLPQDGKGNPSKKTGEAADKGKAKLVSEVSGNGKGLLGLAPTLITPLATGPRPKEDANRASTSLSTDVHQVQSSGPSKALVIDGPKIVNSPSLQPMASDTVIGPNGTHIQIPEIQSPSRKPSRKREKTTTTTNERLKQTKNSKMKSKKHSLIKCNPTKPLQIWSPVKDKKNRSKNRTASLTLQDINAWTGAVENAGMFKSGEEGVTPMSEHPLTSQVAVVGDTQPS
ncbi:unnamed protein product [Linum tenue]|uniref:CCHC-type domain-containing protein n=2 Tax=Linum tenue TaxID=586396 RepID=A0AAV0LXF9_9ROSI|nr:unnamed protein product [Linum tenue]